MGLAEEAMSCRGKVRENMTVENVPRKRKGLPRVPKGARGVELAEMTEWTALRAGIGQNTPLAGGPGIRRRRQVHHSKGPTVHDLDQPIGPHAALRSTRNFSLASSQEAPGRT